MDYSHSPFNLFTISCELILISATSIRKECGLFFIYTKNGGEKVEYVVLIVEI